MIWSSFGRMWAALPNAAASLTALGVSAFIKTMLDDADAATARTTLGLGTAAVKNTGTSGDAVPLLNAGNTWSAAQTFTLSNSFAIPIQFISTAADANAGPYFYLYRDSASPAANDLMGTVSMRGKDDAGNVTTYAEFYATIIDPVNGSEDGRIDFVTIAAASGGVRLRMAAGLFHPSATGGDKGNNTINFGAVYDDNTLLTCYPFDAYLDGKIDFEKWDAKVPDRPIPEVFEDIETDTGEKDEAGNPIIERKRVILEPARIEPRIHEDMRKFAARLGTEHDPLDIDKYEAHWREKRHLSSLPNEATFDPVKGLPTGAWIQRLVETVEIQAIHISQLNARLKALETARAR